ncbi:hypothetical protein K402DRAFT_183971 [Aulographum hederae CBS 113979]|uniref:Uncharacterized protein n=1 Tax=Aulographum hederae CBS 113979 TaxID=1176131 RepID=A0A6G1GQC5_9PEZI|nr:hypothetical protein K402DRAFT_183971 [Aulographum hederae CBS 113979]
MFRRRIVRVGYRKSTGFCCTMVSIGNSDIWMAVALIFPSMFGGLDIEECSFSVVQLQVW